jgi:electron transfer flavoprotein beta subunit
MANLNEILVLLREVVDPRPPAQPTEEGAAIRDRGLRWMVNPADLEALEVALNLGPSSVTAVALGPKRVEDGLRVALSMGASRAIRVWDHGLEGGDVCSDARLWSRVLEILRPGLVVAGSRLADRGDEPSAALAGARLGLPVVNAAVSCRISGASAEVLRKGDRGARQRITVPMPCVVLFEAGSAIPRYPDTEAFLAACAAEVELWGLPELDLPPWEVGEEGARLRPDGVSFPRPQPIRAATPAADLPAPERVAALLSGGIKARAGVMHFESADETAQRLLQIIRREGLVPEGLP